MIRPRPTTPIRPAIFALAMALWLTPTIGVRPASASGCHLDERPILACEPHAPVPAWKWTGRARASSPVLERTPCPTESAHPTSGALGLMGLPASIPFSAILEASSPALRPSEDAEVPDPHPFRLERPPEA